MSIDEAKLLLLEGIAMLDHIEHPTEERHQQLEYCSAAMDKLQRAGTLVHQTYPRLSDMISYADTHVPSEYHNNINHAWSGIGEWIA
jgi:hypothetical protein